MKNRLVLNVAFAIAAGLITVSPMLVAATLPDACVSSTTSGLTDETLRKIAEIKESDKLTEKGKLEAIEEALKAHK